VVRPEADPGELRPYRKKEPDILERYVDALSQKGQKGLHILVTNGLQETFTFEVDIEGAIPELPGIRYPEDLVTSSVQNGTTSVAVRMETSKYPNMPSALWRRTFKDEYQTNFMIHMLKGSVLSEQDYAEIVVPVENSSTLTVHLRRDGKPIATGNIHIGSEKISPASEDIVLVPADIAANSIGFDPTSLPETFQVYIWHVPGSDSIDVEDLDPDLVDALTGLGYLE
jgi:hypothetical protein